MDKKENILGTEKIGKLIRKFSIPCIISMLVNSLYNIVDQIFIGQGVGMLGNGATNIVFPIVIVALAIALMFGDGASAYLSLKLGEKKKDDAAKGVGNGIVLSGISAIVLATISSIFLNQLLNIFGCTDNLREFALGYGRIIVIGLPFMIVGISLNSIIRADGNPKYSMASMCIGAILNVILDPIFIFIFKMGVQGAAIATVISQILTFILNIVYISKFKSIKLTKDTFKLKRNVSRKVFLLGVSSFITEFSFVILSSVANNLLGTYGAQTKYGAEIPITVVGIVMKVSQILYSIVLGIAVGSQPILGYNYGARKFDRVKQSLKIVLTLCVSIMIFAFILFQTIPDKLILLFGNGDEKYIEFACLTFRIYLACCICAGVQIPSGIFFQSIGKSSRSAILSLSRQIVFLIPSMFIFGNIFGLMGILYSGAIADIMSFLLAITFLIIELKKLGNESIKTNTIFLDNSEDRKNQFNNVIITIAREYGSRWKICRKISCKETRN